MNLPHILLLDLRIPFKLKRQLIYLLLIRLKGLVDLLEGLNLLVKSRYATFKAFDVIFIHAHFLHMLNVFLSYLASILLKLSLEIYRRFFLLIIVLYRPIRRILDVVAIHISIVEHLLLVLFYGVSLIYLLLRFLLHFGLKTIGLLRLP